MTGETLIHNSSLPQRLSAHPFLRGMLPHHLEVLSESAEIVRFDANEVILRTGDPILGFYLIEEGGVVIEATKDLPTPVAIDQIAAGEPLGWSWLFEPYVSEFDARATKPTTALFFSREHMWQHHDEDLTLGHELFKRTSEVMVRRLQAARRKLVQKHARGAQCACQSLPSERQGRPRSQFESSPASDL